MIKGGIFDMDGVIVDSEPVILKAKQAVLKNHGVARPESYHYQFMGMSYIAMWKVMTKELGLQGQPETYIDEFNQNFQELVKTEGIHAIPGVVAFIKRLKRRGVKLALASSSPMADIQQTLVALKLQEYFPIVLSGYEVAHPKPEPDIFQLALVKLDLKSTDCFVIEDSVNGIKAAQAAKIRTIAFNDPRYNATRQVTTDWVVTQMNQLEFTKDNEIEVVS